MGCDIHWHSETRQDGKWVCDQANTFQITTEDYGIGPESFPEMEDFPGPDRNYWLFGLLNKVRADWPWSFERTDTLPDDMSSEVSEVYKRWDMDAHSPGVRTQAELQAKLEELRLARAEFLINPIEGLRDEHFEGLINDLETILGNLSGEHAPEDRRLVFWFDN